MKNRLIITLSDINGTKSYNIHQIVKKIIFIVLVIAIIVIGGSFWFINYLKNDISKIQTTKANEILSLTKRSEKLKKQNEEYTRQIEEKVKDIDELSLKLDDIETLIGIKDKIVADPIKRATLAKITLLDKMYMLRVIPSGSPLKETHVTASFGYRIHPILKRRQFHKGIDLRAKRRTKIYATADGVVSFVHSRNKGTFGRVIMISHNYGFVTVYGHLYKTKVKMGDVVKKGDVIALSGNSGRSTGPHLHYEVRYASMVLNPKYFLKWDLKHYDMIFDKVRKVKWESLIELIKTQKKQ